MTIKPLSDIHIDPLIAALPKANIHIHPEQIPRLERMSARRDGRSAFDWQALNERLMAEVPPGMARLYEVFAPDDQLNWQGLGLETPEEFMKATLMDIFADDTADGALLVEVRYGVGDRSLLNPDFMQWFRAVERQVQTRYPGFCAEVIGFLRMEDDPTYIRSMEPFLESCLYLAEAGLSGLDFAVFPYVTEARPAYWDIIYRWAERAVAVGLGITVHSGEFSAANLAAVLDMPGLTRIGHAVYAATEERFLQTLAQRQITVECCLSSNVVLGGASSYETHPIRRFVEAGIPVTLNTDDPLRVWTTLAREYAIAAKLGFTLLDLINFTRNAINAAFTSAERRRILLAEIDGWVEKELSNQAT